MDVGLHGWGLTPVHPVMVPRYTVYERAVVFQFFSFGVFFADASHYSTTNPPPFSNRSTLCNEPHGAECRAHPPAVAFYV